MRTDQITTTASYSTSVATTTLASFLDILTHEEWAALGVLGGLILGLLTFIANVYFQSRRTKLLEKKLIKDCLDAEKD